MGLYAILTILAWQLRGTSILLTLTFIYDPTLSNLDACKRSF